MIPTSLTLLNFMCYRGDAAADESPALNLDGLHVVCLSGENGAGKSALLDAITWALWGAARMPDDDLIAQGASEMRVELEFQLGDQRYRVRRARQRGGTGKRGGQTPGKSQLDLQVRDGAGWRALSELTIRETQATIDDLLRMSYQTFINASFLLQGRADEFTARTPAERKQVLAEILDLGEYAALEARAKERSKGLDDQLKGLRGEMGQLRQSAEDLPLWAQQVEQAETKVTALRAEAEGAEAERAAAAEALGKLERLAERRKELLRGLEAQRAEQAGREREIDGLKAAIARAEQLIARRAEIAAGMAQLRAARDERARLDGLRGRHYELREQRQELKLELRDARDALRAQVDQAAQRRDALRERADRLPALRTEIAAAESRLAALAPLAAERERAEVARAAAEQLAARIRDMRQRRAELTAQIEKREDSLVAVRESRREMVDRLDRQLAEALRWQADLERAREAQALLAADEASLAALSAEDQQRGDLVARLRAECDALKDEAARLKERQALLDSGEGACPVCRSELGADGLAHVHAHYDEELQGRRDRFAAAKREADEAARLQKQGRAAIATLERAIGERRMLAARVGPLEQQAAQAEAWRAERDQLHEQLADLQRQIAERDFEPALQAELRALEADLALLGDLAAAEHERQMAVERLGELDAQLRERDRIEGTLEVSRRTLAETAQEVEALPEAERAAEQLAARLEAGDFAHEVRARGREIEEALASLGYSDELLAGARAAAEALEHWEEQERALAMAEQGHSRDRTILQQAEELRARAAAAIDEASREEALLAEQLRGLPQAQARVELAGRGLRERQDALQSAQNDLGQKQGIMKRAQADADRLAVLADQEQAFVQRHGLFAELAEAFGKKGVQAMLIDTAIPQIEDEANRLLGRMTDNQMHLSLDTQRDTKKGDTVETLEIRIADALGTRAYDAFSGGEAMRVNFAVRIALSRLLARRAGARLETLVIDEGFGTLDATGRERMVEAITSVQDDFRRIIVITHIDELKERFPAQIEITKTPLGSRWELR